MGNELIRPIDADTAHAIEEAAKAAGKSVDAVTQGGMYVGWVLGDLPRDLVGIFGDWLLHKRVRRWAEMCEETGGRKRGIEHQQAGSPSVAAINEDREVLKQLWSKLLANALDPNRSKLVRPSLIELLRQLDPLDALIFDQVVKRRDEIPPPPSDLAEGLAQIFTVSRDETFLSLEHLHELGCLAASPNQIPRPPTARVCQRAHLILAVSE
jgi:hypothetical protein